MPRPEPPRPRVAPARSPPSNRMKSNTYSITARAYARARGSHLGATRSCGERSRKRGERIVNIAQVMSWMNRTSNEPACERARFRCPTRGRHAQFDACQPSLQSSATCTHSAMRPACALPRRSCERLHFLYFTRPPRRKRQTREGRKVPPLPAPARPAHPPAIIARASALPILHSPTHWKRQTHEGREMA